MKTHAISMSGHPCCEFPLERHLFEGDDYLCAQCHRPRALHVEDGFRPRLGWGPETSSMNIAAHYRGGHPRFVKPGATGKKDQHDPNHNAQQLARLADYRERVNRQVKERISKALTCGD